MPEEFFKTIAEQSPNATLVFDLDTKRFVYVNHAFNVLAGLEKESLSADNILSMVHPEDRDYLKSSFQQLLTGKAPAYFDFRLQKNNEEKWIRLSPFIFASNTGRSIIAYVSDITADRNNLETLKKYTNKKNSVLAILSHDLRGPLGIANVVTQLLNNKLEDPKLTDLVKTVSKILTQSIDLITDLTGREFLETTGVELSKNRVNIALKLREYMEEAQKSVSLTSRKFNFITSSDNIFLYLDESKFFQIINNLISNALKFTSDEEGIISLTIQEKDDSVLFAFSDNGIGIPERFQATLFDKFTDARRKGLKGEPTIGLGLSIVKLIITWHEGKIWVQSEEGKGTTFYFEIPKTETAA